MWKRSLQHGKGTCLSKGSPSSTIFSALPLLVHVILLYFPEWVIQAIDRICCAFFWKGFKETNFGLCFVYWREVRSHTNQGVLVVLNLRAFNLSVLSK